MIAHINSLIDKLALDHLRGAAEIVDDLLDVFIDIAKEGEAGSTQAMQLYKRAVRSLAKGQPTMAPVLNMLNRCCLIMEECGENWIELQSRFTEIQTESNGKSELILRRVSELPKASNAVLTFSNSSTVGGAIIACHEKGWPEVVICGEGRPLKEGLVLARKLTTAGVPVKVYTDAAAMSQIVNADAVWIGGDALSQKGLVNKVGSLAFAMLAKIMDIPFISLMSSDKLLSPELFPYFSFLPQNPREIASDDAESLEVVNEYYENIPLELVTHIYSENGLFSPGDLLEQTDFEPLSSLFQEITDESA